MTVLNLQGRSTCTYVQPQQQQQLDLSGITESGSYLIVVSE